MQGINEHIIMSFLQGTATENELSAVKEWIDASEENARDIFEIEDEHEQLLADAIPAEKVEAALNKIIGAEEKEFVLPIAQEPAYDNHRSIFRSILRYAAMLVFGVVLGGAAIYIIGANDEPHEMFVAQALGGTQQLTLADGTKVWLHDGATLRYPEVFSDDERTVSLEGKAYFEVAKDAEHPFVVNGNAARVKVLGTKFNYQTMCSDNSEEVALVEGSVDVSNMKTQESVILSPGQKATLDRKAGKLVVSKVNATLVAVWHDDFIPFENASVQEIGDALEEIYGIKVGYGAGIDMQKTYSGVIRRKDDVASVMHLLQHTIPVRYNLNGKSLTILPQ